MNKRPPLPQNLRIDPIKKRLKRKGKKVKSWQLINVLIRLQSVLSIATSAVS